MLVSLVVAAAAAAADPRPSYVVTEDVIYGRKSGVALTLDVYTPPKPNGRGVVQCVSARWTSAKGPPNPVFVGPLAARGYTVFAVVHGGQPRFTVPEAVDDVYRAVRFVRANARRFGVDPDRLGIAGMSAGGHLALMVAAAPRPGDPAAADPVEREPARVAAAGCFYPPTDFLNYGGPGKTAIGTGVQAAYRAAFDFREWDAGQGLFVPVADEARREEIARRISPAQHVTRNSAPAFLIHGDADPKVPLQQSELLAARYKAAGVPCGVVVKPGGGHWWPGMEADTPRIADWFDKYLK